MLTTGKGARGSPALKVTSQYKGVSWNSACSKWVAVLWDRELKRARHIGSFESEEAAARAYDREAIRMLGADAGLNFRESESLGWRVCVCMRFAGHQRPLHPVQDIATHEVAFIVTAAQVLFVFLILHIQSCPSSPAPITPVRPGRVRAADRRGAACA